MKTVIAFFLAALFFASCTKNHHYITGTVIAHPSCAPNTWLVRLDKPSPKLYPFICGPELSSISSAIYHCGNSVFILNMPAALAIDGKKIKFSKWEDMGSYCFSSTLAPHHLEVADISER